MKATRILVAAIGIVGGLLVLERVRAQQPTTRTGSEGSMTEKQTATSTERPKEGTRPHQLGEADFKATLPEDIEWKTFPAFPPSARLAVLVGDLSQPGPYTIRVKVPSGVKLMPHRHPEDRVYTVISGVFYIGEGDRFDPEKLKAHPPGSLIVLPGDTWHFPWAKSGEYVTQVTGIGPLGLEYREAKDDPRNEGS